MTPAERDKMFCDMLRKMTLESAMSAFIPLVEELVNDLHKARADAKYWREKYESQPRPSLGVVS